MAEFLTKEEADSHYGSKGKTNAALTLGIIGTALSGLNTANNGNNCCGNGGILGGILGNNNNCVSMNALNQAEQAKTMAMIQGQVANDLSWANRVASMNDTAALASNLEPRLTDMNNRDWQNRVDSMNDDFVLYGNLRKDIGDTNEKLSDQVQLLTNQSWMRREEDLKEKSNLYVRLMESDQELAAKSAKDKFDLYKSSSESDAALDNKFTKLNYEGRITDLNEKFDMYNKLNDKITELEKAQAKTETALPLMFELSKVNSERYADNGDCKVNNNLLNAANGLQRQLDTKITGQLRYAYSDLCCPVPNISPLYCSPFTPNGSGTTWNGANGCGSCSCSNL